MSSPQFDTPEALAFLRTLVAERSYPGGEAAAQRVLARWLDSNGMQPEFLPTPNAQPNVIARIENGHGPTFMLNGHMDTVLKVDGWTADPWQGWLDGDRFFGLGAADMKCGVVANALAARWMLQHKSAWRGTLLFTSVTDEEAYSFGARALMEAGIRADGCLVSEPYDQKVIIGAAGKVLVQVDVTGKAAHGFHPEAGINAAIEGARFAAGVCQAVPELKHEKVPSSQTVLSIHSGAEQYVITMPDTARVLVTRQIVPGEAKQQVVEKMSAYVTSLNSPAKFAFSTPDPYYAPWSFEDPQHVLLRAMGSAYQAEHGQAPQPEHSVGITDANVFCGEYGIPCVCYGPTGGAFHQCQEWVNVPSITRAARVITNTALGFLSM